MAEKRQYPVSCCSISFRIIFELLNKSNKNYYGIKKFELVDLLFNLYLNNFEKNLYTG